MVRSHPAPPKITVVPRMKSAQSFWGTALTMDSYARRLSQVWIKGRVANQGAQRDAVSAIAYYSHPSVQMHRRPRCRCKQSHSPLLHVYVHARGQHDFERTQIRRCCSMRGFYNISAAQSVAFKGLSPPPGFSLFSISLLPPSYHSFSPCLSLLPPSLHPRIRILSDPPRHGPALCVCVYARFSVFGTTLSHPCTLDIWGA